MHVLLLICDLLDRPGGQLDGGVSAAHRHDETVPLLFHHRPRAGRAVPQLHFGAQGSVTVANRHGLSLALLTGGPAAPCDRSYGAAYATLGRRRIVMDLVGVASVVNVPSGTGLLVGV